MWASEGREEAGRGRGRGREGENENEEEKGGHIKETHLNESAFHLQRVQTNQRTR